MTSSADATYVALLRGINVGGKNKLPMAKLAEMFTTAGCEAVKTYIQSGNVVFTAQAGLTARIPNLIAGEIAEGFGYRVPVVMRTLEELRKVVEGNPFLLQGVPTEKLHVAFLADTPESDRAARLDTSRSLPDAFQLHGREIFLHCPNGIARTKLTNDYFDTTLGTTSTMRNWRTVTTLVSIAGSL